MLKNTTHIRTENGRYLSEDRLVVARTIWGEARGEGARGMEAVANVMMNRANAGGWWGSDPVGVALKEKQFSAWNKGDPNRALMLKQYPGGGDRLFDRAWDIAGLALSGALPDKTGGATHYHTRAIHPYWAASLRKTAEIGNHIFYV